MHPSCAVSHREGCAGRGEERRIEGTGNGPIDALCDAIRDGIGLDVQVVDYHEHAVSGGSSAQAAAYVQVRTGDGETLHGVGLHPSITPRPRSARW